MSEIWSFNIRGLPSNIDELRSNVIINQPLFVFLSETFLNSNIPDTTLGINGYTLLRKDRQSFGGGIACYVKNSISFSRLEKLESAAFESALLNCFAYVV